jgi:hypothetical protein
MGGAKIITGPRAHASLTNSRKEKKEKLYRHSVFFFFFWGRLWKNDVDQYDFSPLQQQHPLSLYFS